jgi:hypothetical protein
MVTTLILGYFLLSKKKLQSREKTTSSNCDACEAIDRLQNN